MKLYIVIRWIYDMPLHYYVVKHIYTDKAKAEKKVKELEASNDEPAIEDDYGPYQGTKYALWERSIDE